MSELLTTDTVAAQLRLEYWIDMICKTYVQLECDAPVASRVICTMKGSCCGVMPPKICCSVA